MRLWWGDEPTFLSISLGDEKKGITPPRGTSVFMGMKEGGIAKKKKSISLIPSSSHKYIEGKTSLSIKISKIINKEEGSTLLLNFSFLLHFPKIILYQKLEVNYFIFYVNL